MAEEGITKIRKDLEQCSAELTDIAETLDLATREVDPAPLNTFHMETINSQLDSLRTKITEDLAMLTRNETDEAAMAEDQRNRTKLLLEWDRLKHCSISLTNFYEAEKISSNLYLALKPTGGSMAIDGVAGFVGETQHPIVSLTLSSPRDKKWERHITAMSMPKVIRDLPLKDASITQDMPHLQNLVLAAPLYHRVGPIDMLLGLNVFPHIFKTGREEGPPNTPSAWDTVFGWAVLGIFSEEGCAQAISASTFIVDPTQSQQASDQLLTRFFKLEEPQTVEKVFSPEEQRVEDHFESTHEYLESERRYRVSLPKTLGELTLGESRSRALHRAQANGKSLLKKKRWSEFQSVMLEYITLGHTVAISPQDVSLPPSQSYYMPVHSVLKETSTSTKVRAVFDASAPSASGVSLNDLLAVGPTLQPTLEQTLLRFRRHSIAISGDISKMYREILLSPADRPMHRFLWRQELGDAWQDFEMQRVTFGVTSSPYMAIRTLMQVATDFGEDFPLAQKHIRESFYVDDFFGGAETVSEASLLRPLLQC